MNVKERGDALLTAYVNKDFKETAHLFFDLGRQSANDPEPVVAVHRYENPSITDKSVSDALRESLLFINNTPGGPEEIPKEQEARKALESLKK